MQAKDVERQITSVGFRQLELFAAVARLGGVQRAAVACGLSQPAATQALALLQQQVGAELLCRGVSGTALTEAGRILHGRIEPALADLRTAIGELGAGNAAGLVRRLTPAQLRTLAIVLESGSLEQAADAAGVTRGALRRSAGVLEAHFGTVFTRTSAGTALTASGRRFAERVGAIRREILLGMRDVRATRERRANAITVGAAQAFGNRLLARVLAALSDDHADARITVLREGPAELITRLRAGEIDLVVGDIDEVGTDLLKERLVATPYFVFSRPGHPLSRPEPVAVEELTRFDWVGGTPGSVREAVREDLFAGLPMPRTAFAASEGAMVGHFVAGSDRLALMTEHESRCGGLALAKLPFDAIESGLGIDVVRRADRAPSFLHTELIASLRAHLCPAAPGAQPARGRRAA